MVRRAPSTLGDALYIPPRRRFVAHREGLSEIWASDLKELRAKVAALRQRRGHGCSEGGPPEARSPP